MSGTMAFDRSMRSYDADGRLHVRRSNMSKATVNPYYGREIPGAEALGLDPDKVYQLLRDPEELAKAAPTFNNLPVLSRHVPVTAHGEDTHQAELVVGSTGTDAAFDGTYLTNSAVIWAGPAIAGVESREQQEWSCAYRYTPDMTLGTFKGLHYDGIMRNIVGNHVALVESGRAGSDVVVCDSQIEGHMKLKSRSALMLSGALAALIAPRLAADSAFDPSPLLRDVTAKNYGRTTKDLPARVVRAVTPLLAADEGIDVDDVIKVIGAIQGSTPAVDADEISDLPAPMDDEPAAVDADGDVLSRVCAFLEGKISDEDMASVAAMGTAPAQDEDGDEDDEDKKDMPPAMDRKTVGRVVASTLSAIRQAERDVAPHVGEITVAMDSAADVYRFALDAAKVDLTGVHPSAFRAMVGMLPDPNATAPAREPRIAQDAAARDDFAARFPTAARLKRI